MASTQTPAVRLAAPHPRPVQVREHRQRQRGPRHRHQPEDGAERDLARLPRGDHHPVNEAPVADRARPRQEDPQRPVDEVRDVARQRQQPEHQRIEHEGQQRHQDQRRGEHVQTLREDPQLAQALAVAHQRRRRGHQHDHRRLDEDGDREDHAVRREVQRGIGKPRDRRRDQRTLDRHHHPGRGQRGPEPGDGPGGERPAGCGVHGLDSSPREPGSPWTKSSRHLSGDATGLGHSASPGRNVKKSLHNVMVTIHYTAEGPHFELLLGPVALDRHARAGEPDLNGGTPAPAPPRRRRSRKPPPHRLSKNSRINATQVRLAALESLPLGITNPSGPIPLEIVRLAALAYDQ